MRKNIIIIGVFAAVLIGFGYYALLATPANETVNKIEQDKDKFAVETDTVSEDEFQTQIGKGTLESLRLSDENIECVIRFKSTEANDTEVEGTYFVSEGRIRGDFLTDSPDLSQKVLSSVIIKEGMMYSWSEIDGKMYGVKMNLSEVSEDNTHSIKPFSMDQEVDYDCKPWVNVDETVFIQPGNVLFNDMNEIFNAGMEYGNIYEENGELPY